jgi:hypothetical protein
VTATEYLIGWYSDVQYADFVHAYGHDVMNWDGFPVIRAINELKMTTWLLQNIGGCRLLPGLPAPAVLVLAPVLALEVVPVQAASTTTMRAFSAAPSPAAVSLMSAMMPPPVVRVAMAGMDPVNVDAMLAPPGAHRDEFPGL